MSYFESLFSPAVVEEWLSAPLSAFKLYVNNEDKGSLANYEIVPRTTVQIPPANSNNPITAWNGFLFPEVTFPGVFAGPPANQKVGLMPIEASLRPSPAAPKPISPNRSARSDSGRDWTGLSSYDLMDARQHELSAGFSVRHDSGSYGPQLMKLAVNIIIAEVCNYLKRTHVFEEEAQSAFKSVVQAILADASQHGEYEEVRDALGAAWSNPYDILSGAAETNYWNEAMSSVPLNAPAAQYENYRRFAENVRSVIPLFIEEATSMWSD